VFLHLREAYSAGEYFAVHLANKSTGVARFSAAFGFVTDVLIVLGDVSPV